MQSTATLPPSRSVSFILHRYGEMAKWKRADDSSSTTTSATTTVLSNQLLCQLKAERFHCGELTGGAVVLHQNVSIGYGHVKQEGEDV